jgi:hypothetical protein
MQQRSLASAWMVRPGSQERVEGAAQAWALQGLGLGQVWVCTEGSEGQCLGKPTFMASTLVRGHSGHGASASADGQATRSSLRVGHVHLAARAAAAPRTPQFRAFLSPGGPKDAQKVLESLWAAQVESHKGHVSPSWPIYRASRVFAQLAARLPHQSQA